MQKLSAVGTFHFEPPSLVSIRSPRDEQGLRNFEAKARTLLVCTEHRTPPPSTIPGGVLLWAAIRCDHKAGMTAASHTPSRHEQPDGRREPLEVYRRKMFPPQAAA